MWIKFESSRKLCCLGWTGVAGEERRERRCSECRVGKALAPRVSLTHHLSKMDCGLRKSWGPKIVLFPFIGIVPHAPLVFSSVVYLASESYDDAVSKGEYLGRAVTGGT